MTDQDGNQDLYTPAQFREHQEGHGQRDPDVHPHAGIVRDKQVSRYLSILATHYDPRESSHDPDDIPGRYVDLDEVKRLKGVDTTETARRAMDGGDMQTLKQMTGDQGQRADVSGIKAVEKLREQVNRPAPMWYMWAEPGSGKTNFACFLGQIWKRQQPEDALVASNIRTLRDTDPWVDDDGNARDGWIANYGELQEWITQDGDPPAEHEQRPKLFIFDEANSSAGGQGEGGYQTRQKLGPMAFKLRKYNGALIVIGHDGKDVHPLIRELGVAVHKEGLKAATFYEDVKNRKGRRPIMSVEGIPETDWTYDDKEATDWSWRQHEGGEEYKADQAARDTAIYTAIRCKEEGMSNRETAKYVPFSHGWVQSRWKEHVSQREHEATVSKVEEVVA